MKAWVRPLHVYIYIYTHTYIFFIYELIISWLTVNLWFYSRKASLKNLSSPSTETQKETKEKKRTKPIWWCSWHFQDHHCLSSFSLYQYLASASGLSQLSSNHIQQSTFVIQNRDLFLAPSNALRRIPFAGWTVLHIGVAVTRLAVQEPQLPKRVFVKLGIMVPLLLYQPRPCFWFILFGSSSLAFLSCLVSSNSLI